MLKELINFFNLSVKLSKDRHSMIFFFFFPGVNYAYCSNFYFLVSNLGNIWGKKAFNILLYVKSIMQALAFILQFDKKNYILRLVIFKTL